MTVVSSKEFVKNEDLYFDIALKNELIIKRGDNMFIVQNFVHNDEPDIIFEPDDDFYRSIPMEEVRDKIVGYIRKKYSS